MASKLWFQFCGNLFEAQGSRVQTKRQCPSGTLVGTGSNQRDYMAVIDSMGHAKLRCYCMLPDAEEEEQRKETLFVWFIEIMITNAKILEF